MEKSSKVETLVITLNNQALKLLKELNPSSALSKLDQALQVLNKNLLNDYDELYWMTYNNYGILLKKSRRFQQALESFLHASTFCEGSPVRQSECLLRACNIYSKLKKHKKALKLALKSLKILTFSNHHIKVVAYQNAGAEYEYLKMRDEAGKMYKAGYSFVKRLFGAKNSVAQMFKNRYKELDFVRKDSVFNIITSKPTRIEAYVSKTPEMKTEKNHNYSLFKNVTSFKNNKNLKSTCKIKSSGHFKSKTPDKLKSPIFNPSSLHLPSHLNSSSLLKSKKISVTPSKAFEDLFMVDSKRSTPKTLGSRNLDPIIFSLNRRPS
jgi:tetratricopeptide (TPR) repeat protein